MTTNLCLTRVPLMAGNANVVEDTMQLGNNIIDLRGQVTRIDGHLCARMIIPREQGCCWYVGEEGEDEGREMQQRVGGKGGKEETSVLFLYILAISTKAPPPVKPSDGATQLSSNFYFCLFPSFLRMSRPSGSRQSTLRRRYGKQLVGWLRSKQSDITARTTGKSRLNTQCSGRPPAALICT